MTECPALPEPRTTPPLVLDPRLHVAGDQRGRNVGVFLCNAGRPLWDDNERLTNG